MSRDRDRDHEAGRPALLHLKLPTDVITSRTTLSAIREAAKAGEKTLVFSYFVETLKHLQSLSPFLHTDTREETASSACHCHNFKNGHWKVPVD
jgi:broad specificity polyphosphatase/5'/3'-nucleotidase SurE